MRKLFLLVLLGLAGCQSFTTPFDTRRPQRADDPMLSTGEQQKRVRYTHAFTDEELAPRSGAADRPEPSPHRQ